MIIKQGDVFTTKAEYIAHGCNTEGVMGAGVAKTVRDLYPNTYKYYRRFCENNLENRLVGDLYPHFENGKMILNLFTQIRPGPDARYEWVFEALLRAARGVDSRVDEGYKMIAMPQIGCGIGGLEWAGVKKIIEAVETIVPDVVFEVWEYVP